MRDTGKLSALDSSDRFDVCIIGSGFAGTVLGRSLAQQGVRTLILESGTSLVRWLLDSRLRGLAAYSVSGNAGYPETRTKSRIIGGNSNFWTGRCERLHPSDFAKHPYTPSANPWPISYEDLEPYYQRAERTLSVRGGKLSDYAPPRREDLPVPSRLNIAGLQSLLAKAGVTVDESPTATPSKALRFFRVQKELLPDYLASPDGVLVSGATVTRLLVDQSGAVAGAEARALDGSKRTVRARFYVVACGGLETPRLLLLSKSEVFPKGIGNTYDRVGRGFNEHPGVNFYARIRHSRETIVPRHKLGRTHQFYDLFRCDGLGSVLPVFIQSWVFPNHLIKPRLSDMWRSLGAVLRRTVWPSLYIGATIEMAPRDENRLTLSENGRDAFGDPLGHLHVSFSDEDRHTLNRTRALIKKTFALVGAEDVREGELTWSRHHIGTCRIGANPTTSVADPNLRVHSCPNLYICGSETFVTGTALPPVLTIVALAHRLADHLLTRLRRG